MPLWEAASESGQLKNVVFDTLPIELEYMQEGLVHGLVGQKYWGWGYDTVQMIYDKMVEGAEYEDWTDSGMDIVTMANLDAMIEAWETSDFTKPLPDPFAEMAEEPAAMHPALEDGKITVAWIPKALNNPVFELGRDGAFVKAEELTAEGPYEVEILYVGSVASDIAEQARVMEDMIAQGVDAIGVSCNDPDGCIDPINTAIDAGIEVMTWDSDAPDSERFTYLGVSNYDGGRAAADLLVRAMGEEGKVAMLTGVPGALNLEERMLGFQDEIAEKYPGIEVVTTVAGYDDINQSVQVVEEAMQANPDLDGWFFVGLWPLFAERGSMPAAHRAGIHARRSGPRPGRTEVLGLGLRHGADDLRQDGRGLGVRGLDRLRHGHRYHGQPGCHDRSLGDQRLHQTAAGSLRRNGRGAGGASGRYAGGQRAV
jgi:ribose transport system substrate-binding protein